MEAEYGCGCVVTLGENCAAAADGVHHLDRAPEIERLKACLAVFRHAWYHDAAPPAQTIRDANELLGNYPASELP